MSVVSIPYTFSSGQTIYSSYINANFSALQTGINNITAAANGVYASDLVPTSSAQATFGGSVIYKFPVGVSSAGPITAQSTSGSSGWVPPVYTLSGAAIANTEHIVRGETSVTVGLSGTSGYTTINLSGAAVFASAASYAVALQYDQQGSTFPGGWNLLQVVPLLNKVSGTQFTIGLGNPNAATSTGTLNIVWTAIGN